MIANDRFERVEVASLAELREWLSANHQRTESRWLVRWKKATPDKFVNRLAVLDELLCWGWVDGLARKLDDARTMQLISPRKQQAWTRTYKDRAMRLENEGRMQEPGRVAIARSKELGLWTVSDPVDRLEVPVDLEEALRAHTSAEQFFISSAPSYRRNVLRWLAAAKRPETRKKRIAAIVVGSAKGEKLPQM